MSADSKARRGLVVTIGNFDGVHLGHRRIFELVKSRAARLGARSLVMTLHPHPRVVLHKIRNFHSLTGLDEKIRLIQGIGLDHLFVLRFSHSTARLSPEAFVRRYVSRGFHTRHLIVGYDFFFGRNRAGNRALLERLSAALGFEVEIVPPIRTGRRIVKSSTIRKLLLRGRAAEARSLLGRSYAFEGWVVRGRGLGRKLGFPTANLKVRDSLIPGKGVYAVWARISSRKGLWGPARMGVMSIGTNPTVGLNRLSIEVHLPGWHSPLYGKRLRVELEDRIRSERKFRSLDALRKQIREDVRMGRKWLGVRSDIP